VTLGGNVTVSTTLTLTDGAVRTGAANILIVSNNAAAAVARTGGFVEGNLRRAFPTGANVTRTFDVGTGTSHTPVAISFASIATAGSVTVSSTAGDHPLIGISAFDRAFTVNRYWTLTNVGIVFTNYSATFSFVAGDLDTDTNTANFQVQRFSGTWNNTTTGVQTGTSTQATGLTAFGDFAVGEFAPIAGSGSFSAVEVGTAVTGAIKTKVSGTSFSLDLVALNTARTALSASFKGTVKAELLNGSNSTGALDANGCRSTWTNIQTLATNPVFSSADGGRKSTAFQENNSYPDVRVRVTYPASGAAVLIGCSIDAFAIRPNALVITKVSDSDPQTAGTANDLTNLVAATATPVPVHKAGRPFTIKATAQNALGTPATTTNYAGSPSTATLSACVGTACTATFGTLVPGTWTADPGPGANGSVITTTANYSDVGAFRLQLVDQTFANVDALDSTTAERYINSNTFDVGRFIPDHLELVAGASIKNRAAFPLCVSSFSYMGEGIGLTMTLEAHQFPTGITTQYDGATPLAKLVIAAPASFGFGAKNGATNLSSRVSATTAGSWANGSASVTGTLSILRNTPDNPDGPFAAVQFGIAPVDADGVAMGTLDQDVDGVGGNDHKTIGLTTEVRFGRLRLKNALGSERLALQVPMQVEYWNATGFVNNLNDSCTTFSRANIVLETYKQNLVPAPNCKTAFPATITFTNGAATPTLASPGAGNNGSVDVRVRLGASSAAGNFCAAVGAAPAATSSAALSYLLGRWNDSADPDVDGTTMYDDDPVARANFGIYNNPSKQFIYQRENY
jgi:hypothetical protein